MRKTLNNTTAKQAKNNVSDIEFWGDGDTFKLISKASSKKEGWMKSTKAMQIDGVGCVVQVTTQQANDTGMLPMLSNGGLDLNAETLKASVVAEALTFVPGTRIEETSDDSGKVISRKLVSINFCGEVKAKTQYKS